MNDDFNGTFKTRQLKYKIFFRSCFCCERWIEITIFFIKIIITPDYINNQNNFSKNGRENMKTHPFTNLTLVRKFITPYIGNTGYCFILTDQILWNMKYAYSYSNTLPVFSVSHSLIVNVSANLWLFNQFFSY